MSGERTPRGMRLHIGIFGRRNVGKSSLVNAMTRQHVSIVSPVAGTTTDPVEKPMEFLPLGPVVFIDTAGIDDVGALGELRMSRTRQVLERSDIGIVVTEPEGWGDFEEKLLCTFDELGTKAIVVINKADLGTPSADLTSRLEKRKTRYVPVSAIQGAGIAELRRAILEVCPDELLSGPSIVSDLVGPGSVVILVVPIDKEAPKGRLILPQVQTIRDLMDHDSLCVVTKERELRLALESLRQKPSLVVTDSQAFLKVAGDTPSDVRMTSFSILFSRFKGDLLTQVEGTLAVDQLKPGNRVLIAEACSHHPIGEDIGRVKIPRWLTQYVGGKLEFDTVQGHDFPENLSPYKLVVHCGACMMNRKEMLSRLLRCRNAGVPCTNYGLVIAYSLGIFERALSPFPTALELYRASALRR